MAKITVDYTTRWDVAVVGTGIGGATVGHALAKTGLRVIFLERGSKIPPGPNRFNLVTAEERLANGWWPHPVTQRHSDGRSERFFAAVGCAVGGSSIHYAAALERMEASDFDPMSSGSRRLSQWPVPYEQFVPFYEAAENLYGLNQEVYQSGEKRFSEWDLALMAAMRANGLKPERMRVAIKYDADCQECIGRICPRQCKAEARSACLEEALRLPNCHLLEGCDVLSLEADPSRVQSIRALHNGEPIEISARVVILAAGALHSPQILLRSRNSHWPNGLANNSDQVGRNLMFHTADLYALWAPRRFDRRSRQRKSLSIRDFYNIDGQRLGYIQSLGVDADSGVIAVHMKNILSRHGIRNELLLSLMVKVPSLIASIALGRASILAASSEDDPDPNNRIILDANEPNGAYFEYTIADDLRKRAYALSEEFAQRIRPWRMIRLSPTLKMNHGHPCGTCRYGEDPDTSVLDKDNRAHDLRNLYVIDASFFPRSGAVNPSLTIAANALRCAPVIAHSVRTSAP